jgi:hypothetical protein
MAKVTQAIESATSRKLQYRDINTSPSNNVAVPFPHAALDPLRTIPQWWAVPIFTARPADSTNAALKNRIRHVLWQLE